MTKLITKLIPENCRAYVLAELLWSSSKLLDWLLNTYVCWKMMFIQTPNKYPLQPCVSFADEKSRANRHALFYECLTTGYFVYFARLMKKHTFAQKQSCFCNVADLEYVNVLNNFFFNEFKLHFNDTSFTLIHSLTYYFKVAKHIFTFSDSVKFQFCYE